MSAALPSILEVFIDSVTNAKLRERVVVLTDSLGADFHRDLGELLRAFDEPQLERFTELWLDVVPEMRTSFIAFILTGDDPDGAFLQYLDDNSECQEAIDLAFTAHIDGLQNLGKSLAEADKAISQSKEEELVLLLSEAQKAEDALEDVEGELETLGDQTDFAPMRRNVQAALQALEGTTRGLRALAGRAAEPEQC